MRAWCAQVTVTPEESKITVLSKGTPNALKGRIPFGGQALPNSTLTAKLLWKKAQKKLAKKKTSETMNKIIPHRSPNSTMEVCIPIKVPSRETSRHHCDVIISMDKELTMRSLGSLKWNHFRSPDVRARPLIDASRGHGDSSTRWKGCRTTLDMIL